MKFTLKDYKIFTIKNYFKVTDFFFIFSGVNLNSSDVIETQQELKKINFKYYKISNKTSTKILRISIYKNVISIIKGVTFFIKPILYKQSLSKKILSNNFENLMFTFLTAHLNTKIYIFNQLNNTNTFNYHKNKLMLHKFMITKLKLYF